MAKMEDSGMSTIEDYPKDPLVLFKSVLERFDNELVTMNLATLDSEFGILNRTVVYRGIVDDSIAFVTERNSQKYRNLKENPKLALTFLFHNLSALNGGLDGYWQVRLFDAEAVELSDAQIVKLWTEEKITAKIRSHICACGKPVDHAQLKEQHDRLLQDYQSGKNALAQTKTYTAFKVQPKRWDFYKGEENKIADRVQYRRSEQLADQWEIEHIGA